MRGSRSGSSHRSGVHVVVMMMVMMMNVMMMMMVHARHRRLVVDGSGARRGAGGCFLRDGISGEAKGEDGRGR